MSYHVSIATNRFGLGALPNEQQTVGKSPKKWLKKQLQPISFSAHLPDSAEISLKLHQYRIKKNNEKKNQQQNTVVPSKKNKKQNNTMSADMAEPSMLENYPRKTFITLAADTIIQAVNSPASINWRLLDFFSNHFSVTASGPLMQGLAVTLEREAIAPHLLGNFDEMFLAVVQHPAMLIYLNNEKSFGPNSPLGKRGKGLNENLAREILELHTLGVNSGYEQNDVLELAKGITGWTVAHPIKDKTQGFKFVNTGHEPGNRQLLGNTYKQKGIQQGIAMLKDIAQHPATAQHLCYKLAHHFISDNPPASLVNKLVARWQQSNGNIKAVMETLIDAEESWQTSSEKFKTPREFIISSLRALGVSKINDGRLLKFFSTLGQQPFNAGSPAGFGDSQADWDGASALMARIDWANNLASIAKSLTGKNSINAEVIMKNSFADNISQRTYHGVLRAESRNQALVLLLMSPEFQRR